jgi:hypothetical protein
MKDRPHSTCELVYVDIDCQFVIVPMQAKRIGLKISQSMAKVLESERLSISNKRKKMISKKKKIL